jgi:hypothetical protein
MVNRETAIFRNFGCISSIFRSIAAQKVNILGKLSKLRHTDQFGLATPVLNDQKLFIYSKHKNYESIQISGEENFENILIRILRRF